MFWLVMLIRQLSEIAKVGVEQAGFAGNKHLKIMCTIYLYYLDDIRALASKNDDPENKWSTLDNEGVEELAEFARSYAIELPDMEAMGLIALSERKDPDGSE